MSSEDLKLPKQQQRLYDALRGKGDVAIVELYDAIDPAEPAQKGPRGGERHAQQYLGPYFTKMNRRLKARGLAVKPGDLKGTYRLCAL